MAAICALAQVDAVFANVNQQNRLCFGDGIGDFSCSDLVTPPACGGVDLGFVIDDQDLDAVFAGGELGFEGGVPVPNRLCLGDDGGGFSCSDFGGGCTTGGLALGYVDGDERLDVVFANRPCCLKSQCSGGENVICLGDGNGNFHCSDISGDTNFTRGVALGDVGSKEIFSDGFESGDMSAWSGSVP